MERREEERKRQEEERKRQEEEKKEEKAEKRFSEIETRLQNVVKTKEDENRGKAQERMEGDIYARLNKVVRAYLGPLPTKRDVTKASDADNAVVPYQAVSQLVSLASKGQELVQNQQQLQHEQGQWHQQRYIEQQRDAAQRLLTEQRAGLRVAIRLANQLAISMRQSMNQAETEAWNLFVAQQGNDVSSPQAMMRRGIQQQYRVVRHHAIRLRFEGYLRWLEQADSNVDQMSSENLARLADAMDTELDATRVRVTELHQWLASLLPGFTTGVATGNATLGGLASYTRGTIEGNPRPAYTAWLQHRAAPRQQEAPAPQTVTMQATGPAVPSRQLALTAPPEPIGDAMDGVQSHEFSDDVGEFAGERGGAGTG
ncbi:hypothetical protein MMC24_005954 [Lignoscripta atroalba]|nr:hypothetical protein [Lignoscripta atroalba]